MKLPHPDINKSPTCEIAIPPAPLFSSEPKSPLYFKNTFRTSPSKFVSQPFRKTILKLLPGPEATDSPSNVNFAHNSPSGKSFSAPYHSLRAAVVPYRIQRLPSFLRIPPANKSVPGNLLASNGFDFENAFGPSVAPEFHFLYAITDGGALKICNCAVGA